MIKQRSLVVAARARLGRTGRSPTRSTLRRRRRPAPGHPMQLGADHRAHASRRPRPHRVQLQRQRNNADDSTSANKYSNSIAGGHRRRVNLPILRLGQRASAPTAVRSAREDANDRADASRSSMTAIVTDVLPSGALAIAGDQKLIDQRHPASAARHRDDPRRRHRQHRQRALVERRQHRCASSAAYDTQEQQPGHLAKDHRTSCSDDDDDEEQRRRRRPCARRCWRSSRAPARVSAQAVLLKDIANVQGVTAQPAGRLRHRRRSQPDRRLDVGALHEQDDSEHPADVRSLDGVDRRPHARRRGRHGHREAAAVRALRRQRRRARLRDRRFDHACKAERWCSPSCAARTTSSTRRRKARSRSAASRPTPAAPAVRTRSRRTSSRRGRVPSGARDRARHDHEPAAGSGRLLTTCSRRPTTRRPRTRSPALNKRFGGGTAHALDAETDPRHLPREYSTIRWSFWPTPAICASTPDQLAKVVINERTGTIVMGGDITLAPVAIAHGNLSITIATNNQAVPAGAVHQRADRQRRRTRRVKTTETGRKLIYITRRRDAQPGRPRAQHDRRLAARPHLDRAGAARIGFAASRRSISSDVTRSTAAPRPSTPRSRPTNRRR